MIGEEYPPLGETEDFGPYLAKVKAADPDAVYVFFAGGPAIKFVKEWAAFGLKGEIQLAGARLAQLGAVHQTRRGWTRRAPSASSTTCRRSTRRRITRSRSSFAPRTARAGSEFGVAAYDSARLIVDALKATGGNTADKEALVAAMLATRFDGPRGPFRIDPRTNNVIQNVYIFEVQAQGDGVVAVVQDVVADVQDPPNGCTL